MKIEKHRTDVLKNSVFHAWTADNQRISDTTFRRKLAGDCINPKYIEIVGRDEPPSMSAKMVVVTSKNATAVQEYFVRCRKCMNCRRAKMKLWQARAIEESTRSLFNWFITLTFAPKWRTEVEYKASLALERRGYKQPYTNKVWCDQLARVAGCEVTKFLKRVRKNNPSTYIRYILVTEFHKDGFPHFHMIIHENKGHITKENIQGQWTVGFSNCKSMNDLKRIFYITKYVGKDLTTRVRASINYGREIIIRNDDELTPNGQCKRERSDAI